MPQFLASATTCGCWMPRQNLKFPEFWL
ncbi:hypothetical protein LINPERPRIM_LOCUS26914 [Linum perenne]